MLYNLISSKKNEWISSPDCSIKPIIEHINSVGFLRLPQIEAIETYLFLKIKGNNKPLHQLFSKGFFLKNEDLSAININQQARDYLESHTEARSLYEFSSLKNGKEKLLPQLENLIIEKPESLDYKEIFRNIFYNIDYSDYLFSLPMGAGKTFLMAAIIYLDLYFSQLEPENKLFAHNFIILVPSGLKSSIIPSLRSIEKFNPSWILPEPAASRLKNQVIFEVLDQPRSAKKSTRAKNPNVQKVNLHISPGNPFGLVLVVNAEKVILDRLDLSDQLELIEHSEDVRDKQANELRNLIGKIPNLQIHIDEVHHAAKDDIKLRQVVTKWNTNGTINSVLGYSGTPYLSSSEKLEIHPELNLKFSQITNTVYYFPLLKAVEDFLKRPTVKEAKNLSSLEIIKNGVEEFYSLYGNKIYTNGTTAKLAIYCGGIPRLEEEVYPFLIKDLGIKPDEILKYHGGNKQFKLPKENVLEYAILDTPYSKKKIILLVQIGKEGWDCKSLTGVILSQHKDCPPNMVLQTSCRCLREVDKYEDETALIWLNESNAIVLNKQLEDEQQTTIRELNSIGRSAKDELVDRTSRIDYLKLPQVDFYQLKVNYNTLIIEETPNTEHKLNDIIKNVSNGSILYYNQAEIRESGFDPARIPARFYIYKSGSSKASFNNWLFSISKESFFLIPLDKIHTYSNQLYEIFKAITFNANGCLYYNDLYNQSFIKSHIRLAFSIKRGLDSSTEVIPKSANLLLIEKLSPISKNKAFPDERSVSEINKYDAGNFTIAEVEVQRENENKLRKAIFVKPPADALFAPQEPDLIPPLNDEVKIKDKTFHYIPYDFSQSGFERQFLLQSFSLSEFSNKNLEIYYNGDRFVTSFKIKCFSNNKKSYNYVGDYTPDFLIIKRNGSKLHKILIVETKGDIYSHDPKFQKRKTFVETEFLKQNNEKFGYARFDFLMLNDKKKLDDNIAELNKRITKFFND